MATKEFRAGETYGRLKITAVKREGKARIAVCECKCGASVIVRESLLTCGVVTSCGCAPARAKNLSNQTFGQLTVLEPVDWRGSDGSICWRCRCSCGNEVVISSNKLRMGRAKSCGCAKGSGLRESKTYVAGTCLEIIASSKLPKHNTSGIKGVARKRRKWQAYIMVSGKQYALGTYATLKEAVVARWLAEQAREQYILLALEGDESAISFDALLERYIDTQRVSQKTVQTRERLSEVTRLFQTLAAIDTRRERILKP